MHISWKEHRLPDIGKVQHGHYKSLSAQSPPGVRWHTVTEWPKVKFKTLRVQTFPLYLFHE
jgi:hypothetical protein